MTLLTLSTVVSGILLAPLALISVLTGYCMKTPGLIRILTLGMLSDYNLCSLIHVDITPDTLALIGSIHVVLAIESIYRKYYGINWMLNYLLKLYRLIAYILCSLVIILAILHLIVI
ncbi:MAG: hypothetical protein QXO93_04505 [Acidilobaceae archaeon]